MIRLYTDAAVNGDLGQAGIGLLFIANKKTKAIFHSFRRKRLE